MADFRIEMTILPDPANTETVDFRGTAEGDDGTFPVAISMSTENFAQLGSPDNITLRIRPRDTR